MSLYVFEFTSVSLFLFPCVPLFSISRILFPLSPIPHPPIPLSLAIIQQVISNVLCCTRYSPSLPLTPCSVLYGYLMAWIPVVVCTCTLVRPGDETAASYVTAPNESQCRAPLLNFRTIPYCTEYPLSASSLP